MKRKQPCAIQSAANRVLQLRGVCNRSLSSLGSLSGRSRTNNRYYQSFLEAPSVNAETGYSFMTSVTCTCVTHVSHFHIESVSFLPHRLLCCMVHSHLRAMSQPTIIPVSSNTDEPPFKKQKKSKPKTSNVSCVISSW